MIFIFILFSCEAALSWPSSVYREGDAVAWKVGDVLIWRFPLQYEKKIRTASDTLDSLYKKGFSLKDIKVHKEKNEWRLSIAGKVICTAAREHARGAGTDPRTISLLWLTRLYDAFGKMHSAPLGPKYKLRGSYAINSKVSWYGGKFVGRKTASGEIFTDTLMSAAARGLPFGTLVRVTVPATKKSVVVRVTDRFNEHKKRALDLSSAAADLLGIKRMGVAAANIKVIGKVDRIGSK